MRFPFTGVIPVDKPVGVSSRHVVDVVAGAKRLRELWRDQAGRERMGQTAQDAWRARFTWEKIVSDYERLFFDLVEAPS